MNTKNIPLIIGLALPVLMMAAIAAVIIIPGWYVHPKTDFVYAIGQYRGYVTYEKDAQVSHSYSVANGKITENITKTPATLSYYPYQKEEMPRFFLHHTDSNTNEELSLEAAQQLKLSDDEKSPDGFTVSQGSSSDGFFPFYDGRSNDQSTGYLSNGTANKKITLISKTNNYSFQLVGWVVK